MAYTIVLADPIHEQGIAILEQIATVRQAGGIPLTDQIRDAHALVARLTKVTPALIDAAPSLRAISRHGVGVDSVNVTYATSRGHSSAVYSRPQTRNRWRSTRWG